MCGLEPTSHNYSSVKNMNLKFSYLLSTYLRMHFPIIGMNRKHYIVEKGTESKHTRTILCQLFNKNLSGIDMERFYLSSIRFIPYV